MPWFYANAGQQVGPINDADFERLTREGVIQPATLVWRERDGRMAAVGECPRPARPSPRPGHLQRMRQARARGRDGAGGQRDDLRGVQTDLRPEAARRTSHGRRSGFSLRRFRIRVPAAIISCVILFDRGPLVSTLTGSRSCNRSVWSGTGHARLGVPGGEFVLDTTYRSCSLPNTAARSANCFAACASLRRTETSQLRAFARTRLAQ